MTARDFADQIRRNVEALRNNREAELKIIGLDLVAVLKDRIQRSGENYQGAKFTPYTPGYATQRQKKGFQIGYVDFTRSGRLWASVYPDVDGNGAKFTVVISAHGADNIKKVTKAEKKRGNILRPSQDELNLAEQANAARVRKYLQF